MVMTKWLAPALLGIAFSGALPDVEAHASETSTDSEVVRTGSWHSDYSVSVAARNLPLGASATGEMGIGTLLWGERKGDDFLYGYFRAVGKLRTSGLINRIDLGLQFYPISIFGVTLGYAESVRASQGVSAECSYAACQGTVNSPYANASLKLGYGRFGLAGDATWGPVQPSITDRVFYDETMSLIGLQGGDHGLSTTLALVYSGKDNPSWMGGLAYSGERMLESGSTGNFVGAFGRYKKDEWAISIGAGTYESNIEARGLSVFAQFKWTGKKSMEL